MLNTSTLVNCRMLFCLLCLTGFALNSSWASDSSTCITPTNTLNNRCVDAYDLSGTPGSTVCLAGCLEGAQPTTSTGGGCFSFFNTPSVWYEFTTPNNGAPQMLVTITVQSQMEFPRIAIVSGNCNGNLTSVACRSGQQGIVEFINISLDANRNYKLVVASQDQVVGDFEVCISYSDPSFTCNVNSQLDVVSTSMGSPALGPYLPGESVGFCYFINWTSGGNNCQWLHGIVPDFGNCWAPSSFLANGQPANVSTPLGGANWNWFEEGMVTYHINNGILPQGTPVGAGWFVTGVAANPIVPPCGPNDYLVDPNCSWGVPQGCNTQTTFQLCFELEVAENQNCPGDSPYYDCSIGMKTYGDGETGGWGQAGCTADGADFFNVFSFCCVDDFTQYPTILEDTLLYVQTGDTLTVPLVGTGIPGLGTFQWTVDDPFNTGSEDCLFNCADSIIQELENPFSYPILVYYFVRRIVDNCVSLLPEELGVWILPDCVPLTNFAIEVEDAPCVGELGSATFSYSGTDSLALQWSNGTDGVQATLPTGEHYLSITDPNGCITVDTFFIEAPTEMINEFEVDAPNCLGRATIMSQTTGGTPPYFHEWLAPLNTAGPNVIVDQPGTYSVRVTDAQGCEIVDQLAISFSTLSLVNILTLTRPLCTMEATALTGILANPDPSQSYSFEWSTGSTLQEDTVYTDGWYYLTIRDSFGCEIRDSVWADIPYLPLDLDSIHHISCFGAMDGAIIVNLIDGNPPYTYEWQLDSQVISTQNAIQNLGPGFYTLNYEDASGCNSSLSYELTEPELLTAQLNQSQDSTNGNIIVATTVNGGTAPYNYLWSDGSQADHLLVTANGWVVVTITDAAGCIVIDSLEIIMVSIGQEPESKEGPTIYPNPNNGNFYLDFSGPISKPCRIRIYGTDGRLYLDQELSAQKQKIFLRQDDWSSGMYLLYWEMGKHSGALRWVKD